jgi:hypothetical protein
MSVNVPLFFPPAAPLTSFQVELYPRLSIDDSARVRELSHQLLFHLLNAAKKRMAKRLPSFVGPWVAGTLDRDKRVLRAASDAFASFLQTREKEAAFWKAVQTRVIEFATEAIKETPDTLSDERSTTKQDSDAKYFRVVGASLSLVQSLVRRGDLTALEDGLASYLQVDALWTMSKAEDGFVRRAFYQFLHTLLEVRPEILEPRLQQVGKALVADSVKNIQAGSAADLLRVLAALTTRFPQVWGTQKHPLQRVQQFLAQGSQGGAEEYWRALYQLLETLPDKTPSVEVVSAFLSSMRKGIADRLETRTGRHEALRTYAQVFGLFLGHSPLSANFLEDNLSNLTRQYLHPSPESSLPSPQRPEPLAEAWLFVAGHSDDETRGAVTEEWQTLGSALLSHMSNSLPEVSEGYRKSQTALASEGERWFTFVANILSRVVDGPSLLRDVVTKSSTEVLRGALDLLTRRNFKPFGAAAVIQSSFRHCPQLCADNDLLASLFPAGQTESYGVIAASPSLAYLVSDLNTISGGRDGQAREIWTSLAEAALRLSDPPSVVTAVRVLIGVPSAAEYATQLALLQSFLVSAWKEYAHSGEMPGLKDLCEATLAYGVLAQESLGLVAADIISGLEAPETSPSAVVALELALKKKPQLLSADHNLHVRLVASLLALTELSDSSISGKARSLKSLLDEHPTERNPVARVLENHLEEATPSSLEIDTLVQQALTVIESAALLAEDIFPSSTVWMRELATFLTRPPNPSLSLASSMGGAYFLVQGDPNAKLPVPDRDSSGRSIPARMALFTAKLLSSGVQLSSLPPEFQLELVYLLCFTEAIAGDQLSAAQPGGLWSDGPEGEAGLQEFCELSSAAVRAIVADCGNWTDWSMSGDSLVERLINFMLHQGVGSSPSAFYAAKSLSSLLQLLVQVHGGPPAQLEQWVVKLGIMTAVPNTALIATAFLTGFGDALASSKAVTTLCARLISEMPGFRDFSNPRALPSLVLLNHCMDVYEAGEVPVETRKQVLALQQFTRWTDAPEQLGFRAATETCKAIARLVPGTKDTYGPYWEQAVKFCIWLWKKAAEDTPDERLPYIHASLKLMQALHAVEEPNDDLEEVLASRKEAESAALIGLLCIPREATASLPSALVDALLARAVSKIPNVQLADLEDVYESVASESREIQKAAFGLLHKALPAAQDDINLAVVMDKKGKDQSPAEVVRILTPFSRQPPG